MKLLSIQLNLSKPNLHKTKKTKQKLKTLFFFQIIRDHMFLRYVTGARFQ